MHVTAFNKLFFVYFTEFCDRIMLEPSTNSLHDGELLWKSGSGNNTRNISKSQAISALQNLFRI